MSDNITLPPISGDSKKAATDAVSYSGDVADIQLIRLVEVTGSEGSKTVISPYSLVSTANSSTATLNSGVAFTGTSEAVKDYASIEVSVIASHASGTDGLSIQQSADGTNWDFIDTYTIAAATGKTFSFQPIASYYRIVYTNGGTNQTYFRLQTVFHYRLTKPSSQRPADAVSNENDFEQVWAVNSVFNGTTWDRQRGDTNGTYVGGNVAHDGIDAGGPVKVGAKAVSALSTATMVAAADRADAVSDLDGAMITKPYAPNADILVERLTNTDGASTASTVFGATANARNCLTSIILYNDSATNAFVDIRDGTAGTVLLTLPCPAKGGVVFNPNLPLRQTTVNTALAFDASAALTTLYISFIGFKSKA